MKMLNSKTFGRKIKLPFIIFGDFRSILVPEDYGKQNPNESHTEYYLKHFSDSYSYKLVCVDNKFSKHFKP